jgi:hypothetical protein
MRGVYSDVLAPPGPGFWFVTVVGALLTVGPVVVRMVHERQSSTAGESRKNRGYLAFGLFSAVVTLVLIHLFGDGRVLGWLYQAPGTPDSTGLRALLVPFGPVFWLLALLEVGVLLYTVRSRNGDWAITSVFFTLLAFQFITGVPVFPTLVQHYGWALGALAGWLLAGVLWFLWKWDRLARQHRQRYDVVRQGWLASLELDGEQAEYTPQQKLAWEEYFARHNSDDEGLIEYQPRYRDHKSELIGWLMLWPVSMFETFLFDFLADLFHQVYLWFGSVLQRIMLRRWQGTEGHMLTAQERKALAGEGNRPLAGATHSFARAPGKLSS